MNESNSFSIDSVSPDETLAIGRRLAPLLTDRDVVLLNGRLGAGKTLFVGGIADGLGITDPITSPTFTIVKHYHGFLDLTHADMYRLGSTAELADLDILDIPGVLVIEWGEAVESSIPDDHLNIYIEHTSDTARTVHFKACGTWKDRNIEQVLA